MNLYRGRVHGRRRAGHHDGEPLRRFPVPRHTHNRPSVCAPLIADTPAPLGDSWYQAPTGDAPGAALRYSFTRGMWVGCSHAWFDMLLDSDRFLTCTFALLDGERAVFSSMFSPLTQCQTRIVFSVAGADLRAVDGVAIRILRKTEVACRFCVSAVECDSTEPARLDQPLLPMGPLMDEIGQSTLHDWPGKLGSAEKLVDHLQKLHAAAPHKKLPDSMSKWGGWKKSRIDATGFFRTHHDGARWWLVDPEGHLFWSSGADCVHPTIDHEVQFETRHMNLRGALAWMPERGGEFKSVYHNNPYRHWGQQEINFEIANFIRAFGAERWHDAWSTVTFADLRELGFNTAGDWSDEPACSKANVPYVLPLDLHFRFPSVIAVTGGFPDVFDERISQDVTALAENLRAYKEDPALIGYFLTNEPSVGWEMIDERRGLAEAMLLKTPVCATRRELARELRMQYGDDAGLSAAWGMDVTLAQIAEGPWTKPLTADAQRDLTSFSTIMLARLIELASAACRKVDPNHLNLGIRWWTFPPVWALRAMAACDVISFNYYLDRVGMTSYGKPGPETGVEAAMSELNRPAMVGEWHFGSMDGGLPSAGLTRVANQVERGKAFRGYVENAAALPWCVGVHYFNLHDRTAVYCTSSNENYAHGFMDLCHMRHEALCTAARLTHERLYDVASGRVAPFDEKTPQVYPSR